MNGIWHRNLCHKKRKITNNRNRYIKSRKNRMLGKKESNKYLGILEVDTIKYSEMKEIIKRIPQENKKNTQNQIREQESYEE